MGSLCHQSFNYNKLACNPIKGNARPELFQQAILLSVTPIIIIFLLLFSYNRPCSKLKQRVTEDIIYKAYHVYFTKCLAVDVRIFLGLRSTVYRVVAILSFL